MGAVKSNPVRHDGMTCMEVSRDAKGDYESKHGKLYSWNVTIADKDGKEIKGSVKTKSDTSCKFEKGNKYNVDIVTVKSDDPTKSWEFFNFKIIEDKPFTGGKGKFKKTPEEQKSINYALARECAITYFSSPEMDQLSVTRDLVDEATRQIFKWLVKHGTDESTGPRASGCIRRAAMMINIPSMGVNSITAMINEAELEWQKSDPEHFKPKN